MKSIAIIPARGGSKGIKKKNIVPINGIPLIAYTIEAAKDSGVEEVIVSTDDCEIADIAETYGARVIQRPSELATDDCGTEPVIEHVLKEVQCDIFVLLQCTSPFRDIHDIDNCIKLVLDGNDIAISVTNFHGNVWSTRVTNNGQKYEPLTYDPKERKPRQQLNQFIENGSIYAMSSSRFFSNGCKLLTGSEKEKIGFYFMSKENSIEIDDHIDLCMAMALAGDVDAIL